MLVQGMLGYVLSVATCWWKSSSAVSHSLKPIRSVACGHASPTTSPFQENQRHGVGSPGVSVMPLAAPQVCKLCPESTLLSHLPHLFGKINWEAAHGSSLGPGPLNPTQAHWSLSPLRGLPLILCCMGHLGLMGQLHDSDLLFTMHHASQGLYSCYSLCWILGLCPFNIAKPFSLDPLCRAQL